MDSRRLSFIERARIFARIDRLNELKKRKHRLYNYFYRRSLIFVSATILRILFLSFFAWLYFFHGGSGETSKEVVLKKREGIYLQSRKMRIPELDIVTKQGKYNARFETTGMPFIQVGDTITIERNFFGKPSFFSHPGYEDKYELSLNWLLYFLIGMLTIVSLAFNDGLDPMSDKIIWAAWTADLFAFVHYFAV